MDGGVYRFVRFAQDFTRRCALKRLNGAGHAPPGALGYGRQRFLQRAGKALVAAWIRASCLMPVFFGFAAPFGPFPELETSILADT
jgi:hypothetical protein